MNILLVSSYLPYPLYSGGHVRLYNLMKVLSKKHTITLVCEKRSYQTADDIHAVEKICKTVIAVERGQQWSIKNIFKTGFSTDAFLITGHTNFALQEAIKKTLVKESFDLIHAETFYIMQNIPTTRLPIVLVEHNIEYLVYQRYVATVSLFVRPLLLIDVLKLRYKEKQAWRRAAFLIAVSENEKKLMNGRKVVVVPNGVDTEQFLFEKPIQKRYRSLAKGVTLPEKELLFIGDFKWIQNRDTVRWIIQDIWPFLLRAVEGEMKIKLRIVGKHIPPGLKSINTYDSIIFDEHAPEETALIFQQADLLLTPIRVGGGTSYKILEAMASGIPVVTTSLGKKGLEAKDESEIIVADDVQSIIERTVYVLRNKDFYEKITYNARKLVEEKYDWKQIANTLDEVYQSLR